MAMEGLRKAGVVDPGPKPDFSERQKTLLQLIANGLTYAEIGTELHIAEGAVKGGVSSLLRESGTKKREKLIVMGVTEGIIDTKEATKSLDLGLVDKLSNREKKALEIIIGGEWADRSEIARSIGIAPKTFKKLPSSIKRTLQTRNFAQAIALYMEAKRQGKV